MSFKFQKSPKLQKKIKNTTNTYSSICKLSPNSPIFIRFRQISPNFAKIHQISPKTPKFFQTLKITQNLGRMCVAMSPKEQKKNNRSQLISTRLYLFCMYLQCLYDNLCNMASFYNEIKSSTNQLRPVFICFVP